LIFTYFKIDRTERAEISSLAFSFDFQASESKSNEIIFEIKKKLNALKF